MADSGEQLDIQLGAIERFVPEAERRQAADALAYATALVADRLDAGGVFELCYEMAARGIPYYMWPDMVMARAGDAPVEDEALARARRDALAMSLIDRGENETIRRNPRE